MGVPKLFGWIIRRFPSSHIKFRKSEKCIPCHYLYIDANPLLHNAARQVFDYGISPTILIKKNNPYSHLTYPQKIEKVYDLFFDNIVEVINIAPPSELLFIAIDGPAPLSKQAEQRQRRFKAVQETSDKSEPTEINFNSTHITPGTDFMFDLTEFVHLKIREYLNYNSKTNLKVIFSSSRVPGEGEAKIMHYIRNLTDNEKENKIHTMFGPDGDLIMLTMATGCKHINLLRESIFEPEMYDYLKMGEIVSNNIMYEELASNREERGMDVIDDFILLGFLVGNDFLPKIQMFIYLPEGLNLMTQIYRDRILHDTSKGYAAAYLTQDGVINVENLCYFLKLLASKEIKYIFDQRLVSLEDKFRNYTLEGCIYDSRNLPKDFIADEDTYTEPDTTSIFDFTKYRMEYYKKSGVTSEEEIKQMCYQYIVGLIWIFRYYTEGNPCWSWFYPYHYTPFISDVVEYLENNIDIVENINFPQSQPPKQYIQLLCVLPPASAYLLPKHYRKYMTQPTSPLAHLYPKRFEIDYEGKTEAYKGVVLLPFVKLEHILTIYDKNDDSDLKNSFDVNKILYFDKGYSSIFKSKFGTIKNNKIRCLNFVS